MFHGSPFRLNEYIGRNPFDDILGSVRYTNEEVQYTDPFLEMRQMEESWNKNMEDEFNPGWINALDEIMMEWFNKYSNGFMCFGRNPHLFGSDRHTIFCGFTSILWIAHIV